MKKLMTMIAAVATAFGLYATDTNCVSSTDFNSFTVGALSEATGADTRATWTIPQGDESTIEAVSHSTDDVPNVFIDDEENPVTAGNSLKVATKIGNPVYRNNAGTSLDGDAYVDFQTSLTVFEEAPEFGDAYADAKIAIWLQEELNGDEVEGTNLWVRAGYIGGVATNYNCGAIDGLGEWNRVTVKAIADVTDGSEQPGFVLFINKKVVTVAGTYDIGEVALTPQANVWYTNKALFPSLQSTAGVLGLGFDGKGYVDNIAYTTTVPFDGAKDAEFFTLVGGTHVESFTTAGGDIWTANGNALEFVLPEDGTNVSITAITYDENYFGDKTATIVVEAATKYTVGVAKALGATVQIAGQDAQYFETAAAALAELGKATSATTATLELNANSDALEIDNANLTLTLDLAGKKIESKSEEVSAIAVKAGKLTIIDSDGNGVVRGVDFQDGSFSSALALPDEPVEGTVSLAINGGTFYGSIDYTTEDNTTIALNGAKFDAGSNTDPSEEDSCLIGGDIGEGNEWVLANNFWSVQEIEVTEVDLPTAAAYTYDATAKTPYEGTDKYTVTGDTTGTDADSYTVTFALKDKTHNKWKTLDTTADQQVTWTIAKAAATVTPRADQTKVYDQADPVFTYDVTLIGTDVLTGALAREAGEDVGAYVFNIGTLANDNYELTLADNAPKFTITAKAVTVTVELDKTEGNINDQPPVVTVKFDGAAAAVGSFDIAWAPELNMSAAGDYTCTATAKDNYSGTSAGVKFTVKSAAPVVPVDPEDPQPCNDETEANAKVDAYNNASAADKAAMITTPTGSGLDGATKEAYAARFQAVKSGDAVSGFKVTLELKPGEKSALEAQEKTETAKIPVSTIAAAAGATEQKITVTPGFFYSVIANSSLEGMKVRSCQVATASGELTVSLPHYENSGFYTIKASVKAQTSDAAFVEDK